MKLVEDLGMRFPTINSKKRVHFGLFECTLCLKHFESNLYMVRKRNQKHCRACANSNSALTHGMSYNKIYQLYNGMLNRCYGTSNSHQQYREKGITVCDEWYNDFSMFAEWSTNNGYVEGLSLDRKDTTLGYSPANCRWTTLQVQTRNTRKIMSTNTSGYRGVSWMKVRGKFRARIKVDNVAIHLGYFIDALDGAKAYDKYVLENNLEHTINGVLERFPVNPLNR